MLGLQTRHRHSRWKKKEDWILPPVLSSGRKVDRLRSPRPATGRRELSLPPVNVPPVLQDQISSHESRYHEDVHDWNFGKLSALREIALSLEDGYRYYYMGKYLRRHG